MSLSKSTNRSLRMEGLEERQMMAGDVAVEMLGGELLIDGDAAGNAVMVSKLNGGGYQISGLWADGAYTKINGQYSTTVNNVNGIHANMGNGNDSLYVNNTRYGSDLVVEGDLNIRTGGGNDFVRILNTTVKGDVSIVTDQDTATGSPWWNTQPSGDDQVTIEGLIANNNIDIKTGKGSDNVNFDAFFLNNYPQWNVVKQLSIDTGIGTNEDVTVDMDYVFASESINVDTGNGDDFIHTNHAVAAEGINLFTNGGHDTVDVDASDMEWAGLDWQASLWINTGSGNDTVNLDDVSVHGQVVVLTGSGNDAVEMDQVDANDAIYTGLGTGNDTLNISRSSAATAYLLGGSNKYDNDSLETTDNAFGTLYQDGWESYLGKSNRKIAR